MSDLRLFLLVSGICFVAGIYIWGSLKSRKEQRQQTILQHSVTDDVAGLKISSTPDSEIDYSSVLTGLNQAIGQAQNEPAVTDKEQNEGYEELPSEPEELQQVEVNPIFRPEESIEAPHKTGAADINQANASSKNEQIITIHIIPRANEVIEGKTILKVANELDLQFGAMNIFHHYGVGEMKMDSALFSLANMMEPGNFDMNQIDDFRTNGLVMFMCIPSKIDDQLVFELMLNTAQRMAELLSADICDDKRVLMSEQKIELIRSQLSS